MSESRASEGTVNVSRCSRKSGIWRVQIPPITRIGFSMPSARSAMPSSTSATPKASACGARQRATASSPWPYALALRIAMTFDAPTWALTAARFARSRERLTVAYVGRSRASSGSTGARKSMAEEQDSAFGADLES